MNIPDFMVIGAVRYAMGRRTYVVQETCEWLRNNWTELPPNVKAVIDRDLRAQFDKLQDGSGIKWLGDDCDVREWETVRSLFL